MPSAGFWENKAGLPQDFHTRRRSPFRCFHPVFLFVGHGVGQAAILVFCLRRARHSHAALTEYAELGKMRSGAARTAGGYGYTPAKGGVAYADYVTYRTVHRDDYRKKQKPPLWQVTVSMGFAHKPIYSLGS